MIDGTKIAQDLIEVILIGNAKEEVHRELVPRSKMDGAAYVRWDDCWFYFDDYEGPTTEYFKLVDEFHYQEQPYSFDLNKKHINL